jgi:hypothetical protein
LSAYRPPSEKESGVTLRIPMTRQRPGAGSPSSAAAGPGLPVAAPCVVDIVDNLLDPARLGEKDH